MWIPCIEREKIINLLEKELNLKLAIKNARDGYYFWDSPAGITFHFELNRTLFTIYTKKDLPTVFYYTKKDLTKAKKYIESVDKCEWVA